MEKANSRRIHYAWIILLVSFVGVLAAQGVRFSFGAFMQPWEQYFSTNRGTVSAISLVSFLVFAVSQPVVGALIDRVGIKVIFVASTFIVGAATMLSFYATSVWQMFILYGIVASLGFGGASGVTASVAVTNWFHKKRGLALGLVEAGFGAGQMLIVPSSIYLIEEMGWKWTVVLLGLFLIVIICPILAMLLKTRPSEIGTTALGSEESTNEKTEDFEQPSRDQKNRADRTFWFLLIPFFICGFTTTGLMDTHLVPFAQYCGFSPLVTSAAVSSLAAFNILGTLLSGILADRWNNKKILAFIYFARAATVIFLYIFSSNFELMKVFLAPPVLLLIFSISFGFVDFATVAPTVKLLSEHFKGQSVGLFVGWLFMSHQIGSALGSYIPGVLFDRTNDYQLAFLMAFLLLLVAGVLSALLPRDNR